MKTRLLFLLSLTLAAALPAQTAAPPPATTHNLAVWNETGKVYDTNFFTANVEYLGTNINLTALGQTNWPYTAITNAPWSVNSGFGASNVFAFPLGANTNIIVARGFGSTFDATNYYCATLSTNNWAVYTNVLNDRWLTWNVYVFGGYSNMWHVTRSAFPDKGSDTGFLTAIRYSAGKWSDGFSYNFQQLGAAGLYSVRGILIPQQTNVLTADYIAATKALYAPSIITTQLSGPSVIRLEATAAPAGTRSAGTGIVLPTMYKGAAGAESTSSYIQFGGDFSGNSPIQAGNYNAGAGYSAVMLVDPAHGKEGGEMNHAEFELSCVKNGMMGAGAGLSGDCVFQLGTAWSTHDIFMLCMDGRPGTNGLTGLPGSTDPTPQLLQTEYNSAKTLMWVGAFRRTTNSTEEKACMAIKGELVNTNGDTELWMYNPAIKPQSVSTNGKTFLNPAGWDAQIGTRQLGIMTNGVVVKGAVTIAANAAPPLVTGNDGLLWNSNKVLYWVTATKTNLLSNGQ